jgi:hypothetical protein
VTDRLRRAGRGQAVDGSDIVWSIAEGARGRRWREMRRSVEGGLISSLLLETDAEDRFSHIELSTAAGLLTLHPEGDGTLHGNVVTDDGIRHVAGLPWPRDSVVLLAGSPTAAAAAGRTIAVSGTERVHVLTIYVDLAIEESDADVEGGGGRPRVLDPGLPLLRDAQTWPLEEDA